MGYQEKDSNRPETERVPEESSRVETLTALIASALARALGVILVTAGVWAAVIVIVEAWNLYSDPDSIQYFAKSLERASGLDELLASGTPAPRAPAGTGLSAVGPEAGPATEPNQIRPGSLKLSYLFAWPLVVLLLLLIGKLASWAIEAGTRLVFHRR